MWRGRRLRVSEIIGIDIFPDLCPGDVHDLPKRCAGFGQEGPGLSEELYAAARDTLVD